jgi:hypothetical protein
MGWPIGTANGSKFATIAKGDFVLVAHGSMANYGINRRLLACGKVSEIFNRRDTRIDRSEEHRHSQYATLEPFVELDEDPKDCGISFKGTLNGNNPQPKAVFELDPTDPKNPGNQILCNWLKKKVNSSSQSKEGIDTGVVIAKFVSIAESNTEEHQVKTEKKVRIARHQEVQLVEDFTKFLKKKGRVVKRIRYSIGTALYCDAYEPERKHLIEAKASANRLDIRMAIGQLFDYDRLTRAARMGKSQLAVLLPSRPSHDVEQLLDSLRIAAIWRENKSFADNRDSKFV